MANDFSREKKNIYVLYYIIIICYYCNMQWRRGAPAMFHTQYWKAHDIILYIIQTIKWKSRRKRFKQFNASLIFYFVIAYTPAALLYMPNICIYLFVLWFTKCEFESCLSRLNVLKHEWKLYDVNNMLPCIMTSILHRVESLQIRGCSQCRYV